MEFTTEQLEQIERYNNLSQARLDFIRSLTEKYFINFKMNEDGSEMELDFLQLKEELVVEGSTVNKIVFHFNILDIRIQPDALTFRLKV